MQALLWYRMKLLWKKYWFFFLVGILWASIFLIMAIALKIGGGDEDSQAFCFGFTMAFGSMLAALLPILGLQADEQEETTSWLWCLPFTKKKVLLVNYVFTYLCIFGMELYLALICDFTTREWSYLTFPLGLMLFLDSVYIPLHYGLGAQKAALILILFIMIAGVGSGNWIAEQLPRLMTMPQILIGVLVLHGCSIWVSLQIAKKKNF